MDTDRNILIVLKDYMSLVCYYYAGEVVARLVKAGT